MSGNLDTALHLLDRLVSFPTVSDRSNVELIRFIADYLAEYGVRSHLFPDATGQKLGLIAHVGPLVDGGVILSGHTDVVPVEGQSWASDPWTLTARDGRYFGRGTCDMKGFLALVFAAVPAMCAAALVRPIQLAFSFDEEVGCTGTAPLLAALGEHLPRASDVIVGEPSLMRVVSGHKGGIEITTRVTGKAAHSSRPDLGVSAIAYAARLVDWHHQKLREAQNNPGQSGFVPPHTTVQVGTIKGGVAINTVPSDCVFTSDIRFLPTETAQDWLNAYGKEIAKVEDAMRREHPEARITLENVDIIPAMRAEPGGSAEALARRLTGDNSDNLVSYQTEAGHFQNAGFSTVICGPGSIEQAHKPDEYITVSELQHGQAFLEKLIWSLSKA